MTKGRRIEALVICVLAAVSLMGCGGAKSGKTQNNTADIKVVAREEGSGTRGAFTELFGVEDEDDQGEKVDRTTDKASIVNSTLDVMTAVAGDENAIGYCSLGSLNDTVKAIKIEGVVPSVETINDGSYTISRPFNIATNGEQSEAAQDFINFIFSTDGQKVVEDNGYIKQAATQAYAPAAVTGKVSINGSSSVAPLMDKLAKAYQELNKNVEIKIKESDSTTGLNSAIDKGCDIAMSSRDLQEDETNGGLIAAAIAQDGIAVVVNPKSSVSNLTISQVNDIFRGNVSKWNEVK